MPSKKHGRPRANLKGKTISGGALLMTVKERLARLEAIVFDRYYSNTLNARQLFIVDSCQSLTAKAFDLSKDTILSRKKIEPYAWPRLVSMFLAYELSGLSQNKLAALFKRDDHGTVFYAINKVRRVMAQMDETSKERTLQITVIRQRIKEEVKKTWPENDLMTRDPQKSTSSVSDPKRDTSRLGSTRTAG